jgi:hypothetical protein
LTEKIDWCRLGEVSALYDVLVVSVEANVAVVACVEMDDAVSFLIGGEVGCNRLCDWGTGDNCSRCLEAGSCAGAGAVRGEAEGEWTCGGTGVECVEGGEASARP